MYVYLFTYLNSFILKHFWEVFGVWLVGWFFLSVGFLLPFFFFNQKGSYNRSNPVANLLHIGK